MKLNPDCMRDELIYLEEHLDLGKNKFIGAKRLIDEMPQHNPNDIIYTFDKLLEVGFIKAVKAPVNNEGVRYFASDITFEGHQFLANIREPKSWQKVKDIAVEKGLGLSIDTIAHIIPIAIKSILG